MWRGQVIFLDHRWCHFDWYLSCSPRVILMTSNPQPLPSSSQQRSRRQPYPAGILRQHCLAFSMWVLPNIFCIYKGAWLNPIDGATRSERSIPAANINRIRCTGEGTWVAGRSWQWLQGKGETVIPSKKQGLVDGNCNYMWTINAEPSI